MNGLDRAIQKELLDLLCPLMEDERDRRTQLIYWLGQDCPALSQIEWTGAAKRFVLRLIDELDRFGEIRPGKQALWALLEAARQEVGADRQARINALEPAINRQATQSPPHSSPDEPPPSSPQTARDLPSRTERDGPVVFLSYSRADQALIDRLLDDLDRAGHTCWVDTSDIPGGDVWVAAIADGIERAYAVVSLVSEAANRSDWVRLEFLHAKQRGKLIVPVLADRCALPWYMADRQAIPLANDYPGGLRRLLRSLPKPPAATAPTIPSQRQAELAYLRRLQVGELQHTELYTPMAGLAQRMARGRQSDRLPTVVMRPEFRRLARRTERQEPQHRETRSYNDIIEAFAEVRRAVLLGEPGAGKTTTLWKLARDALEAALADPAAPLPLLVSLGKWTDADEPLASFIQGQLGELGVHLDCLLNTRRALLLLDGLNEVPTANRAAKAIRVKSLIEAHPASAALVSCRELDYTRELDLDLDTVDIRPLDPPRILDFVTGYLTAWVDTEETNHGRRIAVGQERGEDLFWKLAGGDEVRQVYAAWRDAGADLSLFWSAPDIPRESPDVWNRTSASQDSIWRRAVQDPRSLMRLGGNPYLLYMLTQVYLTSGGVPANRAVLFDGFVEVLLLREGLATEEEDTGLHYSEMGTRLLTALEDLAWTLQSRRSRADGSASTDATDAATVLSRNEAAEVMENELLYRAAAASLLDAGEESVRFTHQLLQEYFTARGLRARLQTGQLAASALWPGEHWWARAGWEESAVLLAGFYADDCTPVLEWLIQAQPEVAAQCIRDSGSRVPDNALETLRAAWIPRLTDLARDPAPEARAAVGRALGMLRFGGRPLDHRKGVGLRSGPTGRYLPDIDWVEIPAGPFRYQDGKNLKLPGFRIARYPVTNAQYQVFINERGYETDRWWEGLAQRFERPEVPYWNDANHPRETVTWFEAVAFCRWLSDALEFEVRLPTEQEWEKAARGTDGREHPWGPFDAGRANIDETYGDAGPHYLGRTTAVGIYPHGGSPYGVLDMAGNVWEWCLNEYDRWKETGLAGDAPRVLRGGSWDLNQFNARCAYRYDAHPRIRYYSFGFRLVCVSPIA